MKLIAVMKKAFTRADYAVKTALGTTEETRPAPSTYSRWNRSPANAGLPLKAGDVVLPSGQVVAKDAPPPPGERLVADDWTTGNIEFGYESAPPTQAEGPSADFFAQRQSLADRRSR